MPVQDIALIPHLMRRAGFGATLDELERYADLGYEATVEELLYPEDMPPALEDEDLIRRYHVDQNGLLIVDSCQAYLVYRMINTCRPLEEKLALFWHSIFATGYTKLNQPKSILNQIEMFRRIGLGRFRELLVEVSRDPAMIFWLDNKDNHKDAVNENYGREILELFSMGVGNYTEDDVRQCSRAFTGWTIRNAVHHTVRASVDSVWPYGRLDWQYEYRDDDHDDGEKAFLGQQGEFNGEDVIDIICEQPATARFISRHLYNFFVADEPQVPAWETVPPRDPAAIDTLVDSYFESGGEIRAMLRTLFNSHFFKRAQFAKVKSPGGDGRRHRSAIRRLRVPRGRGHSTRAPDRQHGPDARRPAERGGLAHRPGVGHHREPRQPCQFRRAAVRGRHETGRQDHHRARPGTGAGPHARTAGGQLPGAHGSDKCFATHTAGARRAHDRRRWRWRIGRAREGAAAADSRDSRIPDGLRFGGTP